jgi:hypothetical protein
MISKEEWDVYQKHAQQVLTKTLTNMQKEDADLVDATAKETVKGFLHDEAARLQQEWLALLPAQPPPAKDIETVVAELKSVLVRADDRMRTALRLMTRYFELSMLDTIDNMISIQQGTSEEG